MCVNSEGSGSCEPSLLAYALSTTISCIGSNDPYSSTLDITTKTHKFECTMMHVYVKLDVYWNTHVQVYSKHGIHIEYHVLVLSQITTGTSGNCITLEIRFCQC